VNRKQLVARSGLKKTKEIHDMVTVADLIRSEVKAGNEAMVEHSLQENLSRMKREPATIAWFAFRLGSSTFGTFAVFSDEQGRLAHFSQETRARMEQANAFLAQPRIMEQVEILAAKLPLGENKVTVGLLTRYEAKPGKEADVEQSIKAALSAIQQETETTAWFAFRLGSSTFGVFDVFPNEEGRQAHLSAGTARLREKASDLVEASLVIEQVDVFAAKLPTE
jgi:quinol monooxygenase YgiN